MQDWIRIRRRQTIQDANTESIAGSGHEIIEREQFDTSFAVCPTDEGATKCHYMTLLAEHENERSQSTRLNDA